MHKNAHQPRKYVFNHNGCIRYIETELQLSSEEQEKLDALLASFPHSSSDDWPQKFTVINFVEHDRALLKLAANAYDRSGNTMLGIAREYGKSAESVQRLIYLGANLNAPKQKVKKIKSMGIFHPYATV